MAKKKPISRFRLARWITGGAMIALVSYLGWAHQYAEGTPLDTYCPFGAVASLPTTISTGGNYLPIVADSSFILLGIILIITLIAGGVFCGWLCPFGTLQDWIYALRKKVWKKTIVIPEKVDKYLRYLKYLLLALILYMSTSTLMLWYYEFDPYRNFFHWAVETEFTFIAVGFIIITAALIERFWCRYLCPLGAIIQPLSKLGLLKVKKTDNCTGCNLCMKNCGMGLKDIGDVGCNNCMECVSDCPTATKAIEVKFGRKTISYGKSIIPIIGITLAVLLIIGSMGLGIWTSEAAFSNVALPPGSPDFYNYPEVERVVFCTSYFDDVGQVYDLSPAQIYGKLGLDQSLPEHQSVKAVSVQYGIPEDEIKEAIKQLVIERGTVKQP